MRLRRVNACASVEKDASRAVGREEGSLSEHRQRIIEELIFAGKVSAYDVFDELVELQAENVVRAPRGSRVTTTETSTKANTYAARNVEASSPSILLIGLTAAAPCRAHSRRRRDG